MTTYESVWGKSDPNRMWTEVAYRERQLSNLFKALAWISVFGFFGFAFAYLLTGNEATSTLAVFCLVSWMIWGILVIRMRRALRKAVGDW